MLKSFILDSCVLQSIDPSECGDDSWLESLTDCYNDNLQHNDFCKGAGIVDDVDDTYAYDYEYLTAAPWYSVTINTAICNYTTFSAELVYRCIKGDKYQLLIYL